MAQQVWSIKRARRSTLRPRVAADNQPYDLVSQCHFKKGMYRVWAYFQARLAFTPWPPSMCWSSGMASSPTRLASCPSRWLSLVCKRLMPLVTYVMFPS